MTKLLSKGSPARQLHAHKAVSDQAMEICMSLYEAFMADDEIWARWRAQHPGFSRRHLELAFVKKYLYACVEPARTLMASQLREGVDEQLKQAIYDALVLDSTLVRGRHRGAGHLKGKLGNV